MSTLKQTIQRLVGPTVGVWNYSDDFNELWTGLSGHSPLSHHVVIWSGTPQGDGGAVHTGPFVSPLHWAVCAAWRCQRLKRPLLVTVIDLRPLQRVNGLPLMKLLASFKPEATPWLRVLQAADLVAESVRSVENLGFAAKAAVPSTGTLNALRDFVRFSVSDPGDPDNRHSLANLVGPLLLLGRTPTPTPALGGKVRTRAAGHIEALRTVLDTCGLLPAQARPDEAAARVDLPRGTRLFVLDDQWHQGWGEWVCQTLGVKFKPPQRHSGGPQKISDGDGVEVFAAADPSWLTARGLLDGNDKRFALSLDGSTTEGQDILLLDLRLFGGVPDREREFIKTLLPLCERFVGRHAWAGFTARELHGVRTWCDGGGHAADATVHSLLARLLALTDLSLPVVLFSSTGDKDLIEKLAPYGNIISSFHKPRTFGTSVIETVEDFRGALASSLQEAADLTESRTFLRQVNRWASDGRALAGQLTEAASGDGKALPTWRYAEIYIDETGKAPTAVGGYIALYRDENATSELAEKFTWSWGFDREGSFRHASTQKEPYFEEPAPEGVWEKMVDFDSTHSTADLRKELERRRSQVEQVANSAAVGLAGCFLVKGDGASAVPQGPDPTYRSLAATLVEFFLHDWLPALEVAWRIEHGTLQAGIFLASRLLVDDDIPRLLRHHWRFGIPLEARLFNAGKANATVSPERAACAEGLEDIEEHVGYTDRTGQPGAPGAGSVVAPAPTPGDANVSVGGRSVNFEDAYAIVVSVSRIRGRSFRLLRAVGVGMREYGRKHGTTFVGSNNLPWPSQLPRRIHYASDDLLYMPPKAKAENKRPVVTPIVDRGFHADLSPQLTTLLQASRALDMDKTLPRALQYLREASPDDTTPVNGLLPWVALRAEPLVAKMSGWDFIQFATGKVFHPHPEARSHQPERATSPKAERATVTPKPPPPPQRRKPTTDDVMAAWAAIPGDVTATMRLERIALQDGSIATAVVLTRPHPSAVDIFSKVERNLQSRLQKQGFAVRRILVFSSDDDVAARVNNLLARAGTTGFTVRDGSESIEVALTGKLSEELRLLAQAITDRPVVRSAQKKS